MKRITIEKLPSVQNEEQKRHLARYVNFINSRPERKLHQKGFHTHHVYPKSIAKKNNIEDYNGDWNLIELTPREHFIVHMILSYSYNVYSMVYCFRLMVGCGKYKQKLTSRQYESLKLRESKLIQNKVWLRTDINNVFVDKSGVNKYINKGYYPGRIIREDRKYNGSPGKKNGMFGRKQTEDGRKRLSEFAKIKTLNSTWINNGFENKYPYSDEQRNELLNQGFVFGRINKHANTTGGKKFMNDGIKNKTVSIEDIEKYLEKGFVLGQIRHKKEGSTKGRVMINKDGKLKFVKPEDLISFINDGWMKGPIK